METANKPLNWQAIAIEEAETQIRKLVKDEYFKQTPVKAVNGKVARIIVECLNKIRIPGLKVATRQSLTNFYQRQWREISRSLNGYKLQIVRSAIKLTDPSNELVKNVPVRKAQEIYDTANLYGVPMKKFSEDYFKQNVKPVFDRLSKQYPFDPASIPKDADAFWEQNKHINPFK